MVLKEKDVFDEGSWVQFIGLKNSTELNGKIGQVGEKIRHDEGRIIVAVHDKLSFGSNVYSWCNDMFICTRKYLKNPPKKLFKPENLVPIPDDELTSAVRVSCQGEYSQRGKLFEEIKFPKDHPIFFQPQNCYIPEKLGIPLILTKIEVPQNLRDNREKMVNQRLVFLRARVETGLAIDTGNENCDDMDFIGPGYICRPGGIENYTVKEAIKMDDYLNYLMDRYGDPENFNGPRDITPEHYREFRSGIVDEDKYEHDYNYGCMSGSGIY